MEISKLKEIGKSIVWLLGLIILIAQVYRIVAYYIFNVEFEVDFVKDGSFALLGFAMMFIQSALKTAARKIIAKKTE